MYEFGIAGGLSIDHIVTSQDRVHDGILGGSAAYGAVGARLWSNSVGIIARVGADLPPAILAPLLRNGIDLGNVRSSPTICTQRAFVAYETPRDVAEGSPASHYLRLGRPLPKAFLRAAWMEPTDPLPADLPTEVGGLRAVHLAGLRWKSASLLSRSLRSSRVRFITFEPGDDLMRPERMDDLTILLQDVHAFLPSLQQSKRLFQAHCFSIWQMADALAQMGPAVVLIKDSTQGIWLLDVQRNRRWTIPVYPSTVVDLTGAEHAMAGGFLVGIAESDDPLEAALRAAVSASFSVEGTGPCYPLEAMPGLTHARLRSLRQTARRA